MLPPVLGNTNVSIQSKPEYCESCQLSSDQGGCSNAQQFECTAILGLHRRSCLQQLGNFCQPALGWAAGRLFTPSVVRVTFILWFKNTLSYPRFLYYFFFDDESTSNLMYTSRPQCLNSQLADERHAFLSGKQEQNSTEGRRRSHQLLHCDSSQLAIMHENLPSDSIGVADDDSIESVKQNEAMCIVPANGAVACISIEPSELHQ